MKIYVEKLPKSCKYCPMNAYGIEKNYCSLYSINNIGQYIDCWNSKRHKKCPLVNIKIHDRELVKEVCEKIKLKFSDTRTHNWGIEQIELYDFLDQIQRSMRGETGRND